MRTRMEWSLMLLSSLRQLLSATTQMQSLHSNKVPHPKFKEVWVTNYLQLLKKLIWCQFSHKWTTMVDLTCLFKATIWHRLTLEGRLIPRQRPRQLMDLRGINITKLHSLLLRLPLTQLASLREFWPAYSLQLASNLLYHLLNKDNNQLYICLCLKLLSKLSPQHLYLPPTEPTTMSLWPLQKTTDSQAITKTSKWSKLQLASS